MAATRICLEAGVDSARSPRWRELALQRRVESRALRFQLITQIRHKRVKSRSVHRKPDRPNHARIIQLHCGTLPARAIKLAFWRRQCSVSRDLSSLPVFTYTCRIELHALTHNLGSTGSLSRARTPNTHSWTHRNGSRATNRSSASSPNANSREASDLLALRPRLRRRTRFSSRS